MLKEYIQNAISGATIEDLRWALKLFWSNHEFLPHVCTALVAHSRVTDQDLQDILLADDDCLEAIQTSAVLLIKRYPSSDNLLRIVSRSPTKDLGQEAWSLLRQTFPLVADEVAALKKDQYGMELRNLTSQASAYLSGTTTEHQ